MGKRGPQPKWRHPIRSHRVEYQAWQQMNLRCYDPENVSYPRYGGRGITVCPEWRYDFDQFYDDMGPRPDGHSLGRKGHNQPVYCKTACEWQLPTPQTRDRSNTLTVNWKGTEWVAAALAEHLGKDIIPFVQFVWNRINKFGQTGEQAVDDYLAGRDGRSSEAKKKSGMLVRVNGGPVISLKEAGEQRGYSQKYQASRRALKGMTVAQSIGLKDHELD